MVKEVERDKGWERRKEGLLRFLDIEIKRRQEEVGNNAVTDEYHLPDLPLIKISTPQHDSASAMENQGFGRFGSRFEERLLG